MSDSENRQHCHLGERPCLNCGEDSRTLEDGWCPSCCRGSEPKRVQAQNWDRPWTADERDEWNAMLREGETRP